MARKQTYNPNVSALLSKSLGGNARLQPGDQSGVNPNLAASLMALGYLPRHRNMRGELMMPGQTQGGSGLDGQTFRGLDEGAALQGGDRGQYAQPQFSMLPGDTNWNPAAPLPQGFDPFHPTVVSRGGTVDMTTPGRPATPVTGLPGQVGEAFDPYKPPTPATTRTMPYGPSGEEQAIMARDRADFARDPQQFSRYSRLEGPTPPRPAPPPVAAPPPMPAAPQPGQIGVPSPYLQSAAPEVGVPDLPGPPPRPPGMPPAPIGAPSPYMQPPAPPVGAPNVPPSMISLPWMSGLNPAPEPRPYSSDTFVPNDMQPPPSMEGNRGGGGQLPFMFGDTEMFRIGFGGPQGPRPASPLPPKGPMAPYVQGNQQFRKQKPPAGWRGKYSY